MHPVRIMVGLLWAGEFFNFAVLRRPKRPLAFKYLNQKNLFFGPLITAAIIGVFAVVDLLVFYAGIKVFKREEILSKPA